LIDEGKMPWTKGQQFQPVAEIERLRPLAVARRQLADEARCDVLEPGFLERRQERPWIALAEEAAGVGDAEAVARNVFEPLQVVVIGAVRDHGDRSLRLVAANLLGNPLPGGDHR